MVGGKLVVVERRGTGAWVDEIRPRVVAAAAAVAPGLQELEEDQEEEKTKKTDMGRTAR